METIRTFIALELEPSLQQALGHIQETLKKTGADVKWVRPTDIHLTLKFLGDTPSHQLDSIAQTIRSITEQSSSYPLELTKIGAFPTIEHPRVVWIGVEEGKEETKKIAHSLEEKLQGIGFKKEDRGFEPHVTIGRVRSGLNRMALFKALKEFQIEAAMNQKANRITLFKSTLTSQGPIYETLGRFDLKKD